MPIVGSVDSTDRDDYSLGDPYSAWRFDSSGAFAFANVVPVGDNASVYQQGTNGISGGTITLNFAYAGTNGINTLLVGSNNLIVQNSATSALAASFEIIGNVGNGSYTQNNGTLYVIGNGPRRRAAR